MSTPFKSIDPARIEWRDEHPFSTQYQDIYYSATDGLGQSQYVFIQGNDLLERWHNLANDAKFVIAETGFGTGLNFINTWRLWEQHAPAGAQLRYLACEKHPLKPTDLIRALSSWPQLQAYSEQLVADYPLLTPGFHQVFFADGRIQLSLMLGDVHECFEQLLVCGDAQLEPTLRPAFIDAWYLDGFAPDNNPAMWSQDFFKIMTLLSTKGTTAATYTVAQTIRSGLEQQGFTINKRPGFGPKRHMLTAVFNQGSYTTIKPRYTPWQVAKVSAIKNRKAIIIGGGLAGCFMARSLVERGWKVSLFEQNQALAQAASANQQAVLFPKLSAFKSPLTQFMLSAFLYAQEFYRKLLITHPIGCLKGSLLLAFNAKEQQAQKHLQKWLLHYPELAVLVDPSEATALAGLNIETSGLYIPGSGWINSPKLCHILVDHPDISIRTQSYVDCLTYVDDLWQVQDEQAPVVIIANGHMLKQFEQTKELALKCIRGQMTSIPATSSSQALTMPVCGDGHVLPAIAGCHQLGATYGLDRDDVAIETEDDKLNCTKLAKLAPDVTWSNTVVDHWAAIRATTADYLPLVGPVPLHAAFLQQFQSLETNAKRWLATAGSYYPNLYVFTGFGSRGLTSIPLAAQYLAGLINNEISLLPRNLIQAIAPARFLRRDITRGQLKGL